MSSGLSNYDSSRKKYQENINKYTGNEGYLNSLKQASTGAKAAASNIVAQQQNALRNAGQTNSAAAILAANNVANQYANQLNTQQSQAANMGQNAVSAQGQNAQLNLQGDQQRYQNNWNNVSQGLQLAGTAAQTIGALSDEKCKDKINLTKADDFLKKHRTLKSVKLEKKENE
ncbi:MAG: hypothetical protein J6S67_20400 [Methanobrevibacter sp.]|nr:hypothetical protein [Methanobrevibacter sp.]